MLCCAQELERGDDDICEVDMHNSCVLVNETKLKVDLTKYAERHQFNFDEALDEYVDNDQVSLQGQRRSDGNSQLQCESQAYSGFELASMQGIAAQMRHCFLSSWVWCACCRIARLTALAGPTQLVMLPLLFCTAGVPRDC